MIIHMPRVTSATSEGVYIFTATGRKKTCNGGHRTIKKGACTDPKKHFEVINFILGHFCELSRGDLSRKNF